MTRPIGAADVARISAIEDPVLRNLWITQTYADFATRLRAASGGQDHTWCGFAVWASATAGQSIRRQELPSVIVKLLDDSAAHRKLVDGTNRRLWWLRLLLAAPLLATDDIVAALDGAVDEVSARIGHGNKLVYDELAPLFVAFLEAVEAGHLQSADDVEGILGSTGLEIADDVVEAFRWYARAVLVDHPVERARCVLAGNVLAVAHEQQRLQDDIAASMDAGPVSIAKLLERPPHGKKSGRKWHRHSLFRRAVANVANNAWDEIMTELMMTLRVPGASLRLDVDIPAGAGGVLFPPDLGDLATPLDPSEPATIYGRWDRTRGTGKHDASADWEQLRSRMTFIVNLFRSRQQDNTMAVAPFAAAQLAAMDAGKIPDPPLLPAR